MNNSIYDHRARMNIIFITLATGQGIIAIGMLLKGILIQLACITSILFLLVVAPLGYYAAFPVSVPVSAGVYFALKAADIT
jgi:hypothetical protein